MNDTDSQSADALPKEILLVDDSASDILLAIEALKISGASISLLTANGGAAALDLLRARATTARGHVPILVLLDLNMPGLDGEKTLNRIRETDGIFMTSIWVFTTSAQDRDIERMYVAGANGYFCKPSTFSELVEFFQTLERNWPNYVSNYKNTPSAIKQVDAPPLMFIGKEEGVSDVRDSSGGSGRKPPHDSRG